VPSEAYLSGLSSAADDDENSSSMDVELEGEGQKATEMDSIGGTKREVV
jgi:hypothetical protein